MQTLTLGSKYLICGVGLWLVTTIVCIILVTDNNISQDILDKYAELQRIWFNAQIESDNIIFERFNNRLNQLYLNIISTNLDENKLYTIKECFIDLYKEYIWYILESQKCINSHWEKMNSFRSEHNLSYAPGYTRSLEHLNMLIRIDEIMDRLDLDRHELMEKFKIEFKSNGIKALIKNEKYL
uniref:Uncharacterized protein n=1 Tax=Orbilia oligospora TaxID=2813651 RepID=A0A6G6A3K2_ORBOL|nr:hypothetical protein [Orbilia oligospora]